MANTYFHVSPRFSSGSPATVDEYTAQRVARDEREAYDDALSGDLGADLKLKAERRGLGGIVEEMTEWKGGWKVHDLLTDQRFHRLTIEPKKLQPGDKIVEVDGQEPKPHTHKAGNHVAVIFPDDLSGQLVDSEEEAQKMIAAWPGFILVQRGPERVKDGTHVQWTLRTRDGKYMTMLRDGLQLKVERRLPEGVQ